MIKGMFCSKKGEIYIGSIKPKNYSPIEKPELEKKIKNKRKPNFFQCKTCQDAISAKNPPKICATCAKTKSFKKISKKKFELFLKQNFSNRFSPGHMDNRNIFFDKDPKEL